MRRFALPLLLVLPCAAAHAAVPQGTLKASS